MNSFLLAVRSGFGFLSTIPVGITMEGLDELMKRVYLYTFVGIVLGCIIGVFAYLCDQIFPIQITAVFTIAFIYYLTGLNHLDSLADMGDGLTAHGSREKKIKALKDMSLGIGGVAYSAIALIGLYVAITSLYQEVSLVDMAGTAGASFMLLVSLLVSEIGAKQSMLTIATFGKPIHEGLGSMTIKHATLPNFLIGLVMGAIVCFLALGTIGLIALFISILPTFWILNVSNRHFGGVNGDVIGTANEIGRIIALISITLLIKYGIGGMTWTLL